MTYHYEPFRPNQFTIIDYAMAPDEDIHAISGTYIHGELIWLVFHVRLSDPVLADYGTDFITPAVSAIFVRNDSNIMSVAFSEVLSYIALSLSAGMYEPALNVVDYPVKITLNGSEVHVPTFALYVRLLPELPASELTFVLSSLPF